MKRSLRALSVGATLAVALLVGCVAEPLPAAHVAAAAVVPFYYQGYPVYYDAWGYPIFYLDGVVHQVPRSYPRYGLLASPYHAAPYTYRRWRARG